MISKAISSPEVGSSSKPASQCIKIADLVFISGQYPIDEHNEIIAECIEEETFQVIRNIVAILAEMELELRHVVKTTIYLKDLSQLEQIDLIYATYFSAPYPARNVVEVKEMEYPKAHIMMDVIAYDTLAYERQFGYRPYNSSDYGEHDCDTCQDGTCDGSYCN